MEDVKSEIDAVALFVQRGIRLPNIPSVVYAVAQHWDGKRIFLQDGDALVYPFPKLKEVLQYLDCKLPRVERVATYATPQDIFRRTPDELRELRELKLGFFYTGLETGDEQLLQKIGKGVNQDEAVEAGKKVKTAAVKSSLTIILGLGGLEGSRKHVAETARVLSEIDPDYVGALTLTLVPGTPLYKQWQQSEFHPLSPFQSLEELKLIIENCNFTDCFFSSMHASNYLSVRGRLSHDKERMLKSLDTVLDKRDPSLLRPEFLRGL
jgi:coproporphyrinogen III oxidase-like Fe-S oxidoreductase